ncbi:helix-turn-helix transcriptional regulator [Phyllobacterium chamaecytisi]|uniref:helix-turn-helix transcriptional regulator n=1 Tax=Phyllobacterium chamaecytisi TaxID=2876082 RepID=UPI001CCF7667|nr:helix-turn-helix transcriptional regulator [Phyllobacterium sp. KW56]MBZ9603091.1 helix-turn-helix transcriptional regulator [Phyllobacterium sp. KW56]
MTAEKFDFRRVHFFSPAQSDRPWIDRYCEEHRRQLYDLDIVPHADAPFRFESIIRALPNVAIAHSTCSPMRTAHAAKDGDLCMLIPLEGILSLQADNTEYELAAGMGAIGEYGTTATINAPAGMRLLGLRLSRQLLLPLIQRHSDLQGIAVVRDRQAMCLLRGYIAALDIEEAIATPEARQVLAVHIHDLVALACGESLDAHDLIERRGKRAARFAAVKADIVINITNRGLSIEGLAARHGITPRYIGALFASAGITFTSFVLEQRLAYAHRLVADARFLHRNISSIAFESGFGDLSYFNHAFRRRYGATPSDVRRMPLNES